MDLCKRFVRSIRIFHWYFILIGLSNSLIDLPGRWFWIQKLWKFICYLLVLQANIYIFIDRIYPYMEFPLIVDLGVLLIIGNRLNRLLGNISLHTLLLLTSESTCRSFCLRLESIDVLLNRPDLSSIRYN